MINKFKKYIKNAQLSKQIRIIFVLTLLFIFCLVGAGVVYTLSVQERFNSAVKYHVIPLQSLNEIQQIYDINILDTITETMEGNISTKDAKEILVLAKRLLIDKWDEYKEHQLQEIAHFNQEAKKDYFKEEDKNLEKVIGLQGYEMALSDKFTYARALPGRYDFVTYSDAIVTDVLTLPKGLSDHRPILIKATDL